MNFHILMFLYVLLISNSAFAADEIHWTFTGPTSVAFDWRGTEDSISFRVSTATTYTTVAASHPTPLPTSSSGPFWEVQITDLQPNTLYYYLIGNGPEHTFITPPLPGSSDFIVYVEGDIGSTKKYPNVAGVQNIIGNAYGNGFSDFSLLVGDISYADINGIVNVDQHFNDVMTWSQDVAYMPAWGNHEWNTSTTIADHLNNYEGRFALPNSFTSPGASSAIGNGPAEDWYWFDYGNVRFIAYPEPYSGAWSDWNTKVKPVMDAAQKNSDIDFIVTFGHRPAYSSDSPGNTTLQSYLDGLALLYSKYVLDLSGHHHEYERVDPSYSHGVTHIVAGTGHTSPSTFTNTQPSWSLFRTIQPGALKLHFTSTHIQGEFICAPPSSVCSAAGAVLDSFTIGNTSPTVNITAPTAGATVSGTITVSANASDDVGVAGVQFKLDGANLGSEDTTAPYSIAWNTTTISGGGHTLTAVARDAAGNTTTSTAVSVTVNNSATASNLTHQWKFDETSGTTALDSIGTNNAALSNALWVTGKIGNAASFNGTNASGDAGKIGFGTGNFTVAHWVKVNGFKNYAGIFNNRSSASGNIGFHTRTDGTGTITALIDFGATSKTLAVTNVATGTWYHIAVSVDRAGLMKLYVNGVVSGQVDISSFKTTSITNTDNVRVGRDQSSYYFSGVIDDLRIYNTVLSATEISSLYSQ